MPDHLSRDEFAAAALTGLATHWQRKPLADVVRASYDAADAMLAASAPGVVEALRDLVDAIEGHPDKPHSHDAMETAKQVLKRYDGEE